MIHFNNYVNVDSAVLALKNIPHIASAAYDNRIRIQAYIPTDKGMDVNSAVNDIMTVALPGPEYFPKGFHKRGFLWSAYSLKCPMAWEITKGRNTIFIGTRKF